MYHQLIIGGVYRTLNIAISSDVGRRCLIQQSADRGLGGEMHNRYNLIPGHNASDRHIHVRASAIDYRHLDA
jgi:hypothetical protein